MTSKAELLALAAEVETSDPSRELDARIAIAVGFEPEGLFPHTLAGAIKYYAEDMEGLVDDMNSHHSALSQIPHYTTSLDAAYSLVPDGWRLKHLGETFDHPEFGVRMRCDLELTLTEYVISFHKKSFCHAVIAASLRAMASKLED